MNGGSIYLLGVGGMGMASLARYLCDLGYKVYGWDDYVSEKRKNQLNYIQWSEEIPNDCYCCVRSTAITDDHPIYKLAQQQCKCYLRGEFVAEILKDKRLCVVCGSHGKSTTTALLIHFFKQYRIPVSYLLGAEFQNDTYPAGAYVQDAAWTLLELDESDGTIELFSPAVTVVLNTDWDHSDHYSNERAYKEVFLRLCERTTSFVFTQASVNTQAKIVYLEKTIFPHNVYTAQKVFECLTALKVDDNDVRFFPGLKRRQEILLQTKYLTVLSDYAHHPMELESFLKSLPKNQTLYIIFEPHRISRLNNFFESFVKILKPIEHLFLMPVYKAFENKQHLSCALEHALPQALSVDQLRASEFLCPKSKTTVAFIGAGAINEVAQNWVKSFKTILQEQALQSGIELSVDYSLKNLSRLGIGGTALGYCAPKDRQDLKSIVTFCQKFSLDYAIVGAGSNLVIPNRYDGIVIHLTPMKWANCVVQDKFLLHVEAGCPLKKLLDVAEKSNLGGLEFLEGIPGTLGGAVKMNAGMGALGILDRVQYLEVMNNAGDIQNISKEQLSYTYRCYSNLKDGIVLSATLLCEASTQEEICLKRKALRAKRKATQPCDGRSLGCFFKNTHWGSTGKLLDELGLKNIRVGDIFTSAIHANFIMNKGHGRYSDVIQLMRYIRKIVKEKTGITLEPEVCLLGKNWEDIL